MFFRKSDNPDNKTDRKISLRKADVLITGVILWGIVASVYGIKKARDKGENAEEEKAEPVVPQEKGKPNFFFRLYHAIRYGQDYEKKDPRD